MNPNRVRTSSPARRTRQWLVGCAALATLMLPLASAPAVAADAPVLQFERSISLAGGGNTPYGLALAPDGETAYIGYSGPTSDVYLIDLEQGTVAGVVASGGPSPAALAVTPDGSRVWVANTDSDPGTVSVVDPAASSLEQTFDAAGDLPSSIAVSADGAWVYTTVRSPFSVTKLAASSGTALGFPVTSPLEVPIAVVVDPHEPELVYVGGSAASGGAVQLLDTAAGGAAPAVIATPGAVQALVVSPDGTRLYAADFGDDSVAVIDLATFTLLTTIPVGPQPGSIAVSPDGATVYTTSSAGGTLSIIDVASEQVVQRGLGFAPRAVAVSPDGAHVYVTDVNHDALAVFGLPAPVSDPPSDDDELAATGAWSAGWVPAAAVGSLLLGALSLAVVTRRRRA